MQTIERKALVTFSPEQMYLLVKDVERYPEFLSWCTNTALLEETETEMRATIFVKIAGFSQSFTTHNHHEYARSINLALESGPFKSLQGRWVFTPLGDLGCKVALNLSFEFSSGLVNLAFSKGFSKVADRLLNDFVQRAEVVYG